MHGQLSAAASWYVTSRYGQAHGSFGRSGHVGVRVTMSLACTDMCLYCALLPSVLFFVSLLVQQTPRVQSLWHPGSERPVYLTLPAQRSSLLAMFNLLVQKQP